MSLLGHLQSKCIRKMAEFPVFYKSGNISPREIMKQSGYEIVYAQITSEHIVEYLKQRPELIQEWINFTDEIRHFPSWGFLGYREGKWKVIYIEGFGSKREEYFFQDEFTACAKMVWETFESMRK